MTDDNSELIEVLAKAIWVAEEMEPWSERRHKALMRLQATRVIETLARDGLAIMSPTDDDDYTAYENAQQEWRIEE